ncbi:MAG: toll/interleukin-1 receptor domain-containing protein [bacterium]|nr:toll/interleukin-1 receptor domain-containing protein [bacterium]
MSDVFISYSRLDADFVGHLRESLIAQNQEVWIDWEAIPPSQAWWAEIQKGIAKANNFVIVLSPNAMGSPICHLELEYARQLKKRIIPVLYLPYNRDDAIIAIAKRLAQNDQSSTREIWGNRQPHEVVDDNDSDLKHINYFSFTLDDDFDMRFSALLDIIHSDYAHKERHTTLHLRALEWDKRNRDTGFLLIEKELEDAEAWLNSAGNKTPPPTELHAIYIQASRDSENHRSKRLAELEFKAQKLRREQIAGALTAGVGGLMIGLLIFITILFIDNVNAKNARLKQPRNGDICAQTTDISQDLLRYCADFIIIPR